MSDNLSPFEEPADGPTAEDAQEDAWESKDAWAHQDTRASQDARRRHRDRERVRSNPGALIGGAIMIMLGVGMLLRNLGIDVPFFRNWWAIFILIPAVSSLTRVWTEAQTHGRLSGSATGELIWGLVLMMVAFTFLFGVAWSLALPVLLILAGLSFLITAIAANR
jgi:hypothetical protein